MPRTSQNSLPWVTRHGRRGNHDTLQQVQGARGIYRQQGVIDSDMFIYIYTYLNCTRMFEKKNWRLYCLCQCSLSNLDDPNSQTLNKFRNAGQNEQLGKASTPNMRSNEVSKAQTLRFLDACPGTPFKIKTKWLLQVSRHVEWGSHSVSLVSCGDVHPVKHCKICLKQKLVTSYIDSSQSFSM